MAAPRIVDAHHHLWDLGRNRHPWLCDRPLVAGRHGDYSAICHDYLPADLEADASGLDLAGSVYVEAEWDPHDPLGETAWVHEVAERAGLPSAMVAQAWLDADDVAEVLERQASWPLVRGVRHKPSTFHARHAPPPFPRGAMSDARWRRGYALLERHGLAFDLQVPHWHLPEAAALARDHPGTTLIVDHAGIPPLADAAAHALWLADLRVAAAEPNVVVKISGLGRRGAPFAAAAIRRTVLDAIDAFGVDRCMFASNYPVDRLYAGYAEIFAAFDAVVADFSGDERAALFAGTATRVYRLGTHRFRERPSP